MARVALVLAVLLALAPPGARADAGNSSTTSRAEGEGSEENVDTSRPTSGTLSILSGRTLGVGRTVLAVGGGWPGAFGELDLAPSSTFNLAFRGSFVYGSPVMGVRAGLGGDLMASARLHLYGRGTFDVSLVLRLNGTVGESTLVGGDAMGSFGHAFGWSARGEAGGLAGFELSDVVTLTLGLLVGGGVADTPDVGSPGFFGFVTFVGLVAAEFALSEDMFLFVDLEGGVAGADAAGFGDHEIIRAYGGLGFAP